jgi:hypothetical protein
LTRREKNKTVHVYRVRDSRRYFNNTVAGIIAGFVTIVESME